MDVKEWLGEDNELGIDIWEKKYRYKGESFLESFDDWLDRVSGGNKELRKIIKERKFLFGGRTLSNRGTGKHGSFSNCYSRGFVDDSLDDIMQANTDIAKTFKSQGGQGVSLSKLRPKGCGINHGQFQSDGIIPFMEIFNRTTESISQGGSRKGALIMSLDVWHKEAEDFVTIKSNTGRIQKANLSLEIDDEFMECVEKYYKTGEVVTKTIKRCYGGDNWVEYEVTPINLYKKIMETAYNYAEPGCIFTNRFRNYNMMQYCDDYQIETCNPCGEQPLPKHGACNLGSINLSEFVVNPFTKNAHFNTEDFVNTVKIAVDGLDKVIDENLENHALHEQMEMAEKYRNIGLGVMGLHDCFIKLGMTYGSKESIRFADDIMGLMFRSAVIESSNLASKYGTFPAYDPKLLDSDIIKKHFSVNELDALGITANGMRNCSLLSIAPTGSLGTMLNISTGCEPLFALSYTRKTESLNGGEDKYYKVYTGVVNEFKNANSIFDAENLPAYFNTASDVKWHDRVDMQAALQNHVDTAISSTINLPNEITVDEIEQLYLYSWASGLKGVTIFRDGCDRESILSHDDRKDTGKNDEPKHEDIAYDSIVPVSRKTLGTTSGCTYCKKSACGTLYITINKDANGNVVESFVSASKGGICQSNVNAVNRMISVALRSGVKVDEIVDQLKGITCPACVKTIGKGKELDGISCPDIIAKTLMDFYKSNSGVKTTVEIEGMSPEEIRDADSIEIKFNDKSVCPDCGAPLTHDGGCVRCTSCGYSKCG